MAEILIIEDDEVFSEYMEDRNHEPQAAYTLEQARERLAESIPDAILLDQQLPDGFGIRYAVKRSPYCHAALTAAVVSGGVDGADPDNEGGNARAARAHGYGYAAQYHPRFCRVRVDDLRHAGGRDCGPNTRGDEYAHVAQ
ncbi:MAG: hypothetical protein FE835_02140 [Gammaproteobacteria bacterium]|nr:hypothetical protein [Gammaproteobacteria bacterium]